MSTAGTFRALLAAQWLVPVFLIGIESTVLPVSSSAEAVSSAESISTALVDGEAVVMVLLLSVLIVTTAGLWTFRRWAPRLYLVALLSYAIVLLRSEVVVFSGVGQLVAWLDGLMAGGVAAWLLLARDTLPFPKISSPDAG